jgi:Tfp pilus assembly protein PilO
MKKRPSPKLFMALTALTLVVGIGLAMVQYSGLQDTQARVTKLHKSSLDESDLENQLKSSLTKLQLCSATLNHLEKGVPELEYVPTMLKELENIGTENGLEVLGVRPVPKVINPKDKDDKSKKKYTELDIEVQCRGNFRSVKNFIRAMQSFPKIVAARTIAMTPRQTQGKQMGVPKLDVTMELRTYLFPPNKGEMKSAADLAKTPTKEGTANAS